MPPSMTTPIIPRRAGRMRAKRTRVAPDRGSASRGRTGYRMTGSSVGDRHCGGPGEAVGLRAEDEPHEHRVTRAHRHLDPRLRRVLVIRPLVLDLAVTR